MIVFDLQCRQDCGTFEAWFRSNADFDEQLAQGLVECPLCRSAEVTKAPMAPRVAREASGSPLARLAAMQSEMLKGSRWVGDEFADTARAMHNGEVEPQLVHGRATIAEAKELASDGVPVAPLPLPLQPPNQVN